MPVNEHGPSCPVGELGAEWSSAIGSSLAVSVAGNGLEWQQCVQQAEDSAAATGTAANSISLAHSPLSTTRHTHMPGGMSSEGATKSRQTSRITPNPSEKTYRRLSYIG
jgi:hypothetical protein